MGIISSIAGPADLRRYCQRRAQTLAREPLVRVSMSYCDRLPYNNGLSGAVACYRDLVLCTPSRSIRHRLPISIACEMDSIVSLHSSGTTSILQARKGIRAAVAAGCSELRLRWVEDVAAKTTGTRCF